MKRTENQDKIDEYVYQVGKQVYTHMDGSFPKIEDKFIVSLEVGLRLTSVCLHMCKKKEDMEKAYNLILKCVEKIYTDLLKELENE